MQEQQHYRFYRFDGSTTNQQRWDIINKFQKQIIIKDINDINKFTVPIYILQLSTQVGGVGLNLTESDYLVLFDPSWNPSWDTQCIARIWRQGQLRTCHIFRLITIGTIDEKILQRQIRKSNITSFVTEVGLSSPEDAKDNVDTIDSKTTTNTNDILNSSSLENIRNLSLYDINNLFTFQITNDMPETYSYLMEYNKSKVPILPKNPIDIQLIKILDQIFFYYPKIDLHEDTFISSLKNCSAVLSTYIR